MSTSSLKLVCGGLTIVVILLSVFAGYCLFTTAMLQVHVAFAEEQVQIFDEMCRKAISEDDLGKIVDYLQYAVVYYPSGSKQEVGTRLDAIVESHRKSVIRDIIADLRIKSGKDYGDEPQAWIKQFSTFLRNSQN